jgi:hypothetical protein
MVASELLQLAFDLDVDPQVILDAALGTRESPMRKAFLPAIAKGIAGHLSRYMPLLARQDWAHEGGVFLVFARAVETATRTPRRSGSSTSRRGGRGDGSAPWGRLKDVELLLESFVQVAQPRPGFEEGSRALTVTRRRALVLFDHLMKLSPPPPLVRSRAASVSATALLAATLTPGSDLSVKIRALACLGHLSGLGAVKTAVPQSSAPHGVMTGVRDRLRDIVAVFPTSFQRPTGGLTSHYLESRTLAKALLSALPGTSPPGAYLVLDAILPFIADGQQTGTCFGDASSSIFCPPPLPSKIPCH